MTAAVNPEDGALAPALRLLEDAVAALIDEQSALSGSHDCPDCHNETCEPDCDQHTCPGHVTWVESRYMQLRDELAGQQNTGHGIARSMPPLWLDELHATYAEALASVVNSFGDGLERYSDAELTDAEMVAEALEGHARFTIEPAIVDLDVLAPAE